MNHSISCRTRSAGCIGIVVVLMILSSCPPPDPEATGSLIITEIGSTYYVYGSSWIEVYNPSVDAADLSRFRLRSYAVTRTDPAYDAGLVTFNLPSLTIPPGAFAIIRAKFFDDWQTGGRVACVYNATYNAAPFWEANGFVELVNLNGATEDFVRFGNETAGPSTDGWTGGAAPALPFAENLYGHSIARDGSNTDTDGASDWLPRAFATPGGPNDVTSTDDMDQDGIPDANEQSGTSFAGLPLYDWGARDNVPDIFVHIDYMDSDDPGVTPRKEALAKIVAVFDAHGFAIHFDVGDLFGPAVADCNLDGRSHLVPFKQGAALGIQDNSANLFAYKNRYMPLAKKQVFHYLLMAYSQNVDGSGGSSGVGELFGNDFIVTLGNWGLNTSPEYELTMLVNFQASTIMHELGHNLGLGHGGGDSVNYKPNYYSIMNYMYQLDGLPLIGSVREGDRYYWYRYYEVDDEDPSSDFALYFPSGYNDMTVGPFTTSFVMDYSDGTGDPIIESNVDELAGLGRSVSAGVDFNGDGDRIDTGFSFNVVSNVDEAQTHTDYNDWANIDLFFFRYWSGDSSGTTSAITFQLYPDPVGDDRQTICTETLVRRRKDLR